MFSRADPVADRIGRDSRCRRPRSWRRRFGGGAPPLLAIVPQTLGRRSWRAGHCTGDRQRNGGTEDSVGVLALPGFDQPLRVGAVAFRDALRIVVGAWRVARAHSRCRGGGARGVIEQT